ncbi:MAG TPA: sensor histidine kinase [Streptosporangiaceae bacterium]|jgi:anti-sigma regulatory factor (Ser/Thr protein kinase)|nr:sensor histidine kinase [Streptosporangiaceae bacterium]
MEGRDVMARQRTEATQELANRLAIPDREGGFSHSALLYSDSAEYLDGLAEFARMAAAAQAPLQAVVPWPSTMMARGAFPVLPPRSLLADMTDLGRNPARLIPAAQSFADEHPGEHVYCLWEPAWPRRSAAELAEVGRHEALVGLALGDRAMTVLCLYDVGKLSSELIADVERTHPVMISAGRRRESLAYIGLGVLPPDCDAPLPPPGCDAQSLAFTDQLSAVREFSARQARAAGLTVAGGRDLALAVSEIAANAFAYAGGGSLSIWCTDDEIIAQVEDSGHISDPLAGRRRRPADSAGGHGLWLVNLVCDLVERRTSPGGTVTRLHLRRGRRQAFAAPSAP